MIIGGASTTASASAVASTELRQRDEPAHVARVQCADAAVHERQQRERQRDRVQPPREHRRRDVEQRSAAPPVEPPCAKRKDRDERQQARQRIRPRDLAVINEQRGDRDEYRPRRPHGQRKRPGEQSGADEQQTDARDERRHVHSPLREPDRPLQLLVIERQRDAVVGVAQVSDDVEWARTQQLVDRMPLVVDQDLDVELPDPQRRARDEGDEQQRAPCVCARCAARHRYGASLRAGGRCSGQQRLTRPLPTLRHPRAGATATPRLPRKCADARPPPATARIEG